MALLRFFIDFRAEIIGVINNVENENSYFYWDNSTPNYITKNKLSSISSTFTQRAREFGVHIIKRHSSCGNLDHDEDTYVMDNIGDQKIRYKDQNFIWLEPLDYFNENSPCPCSNDISPKKHWVVLDIALNKTADLEICKAIENIFEDLLSAIRNSNDNKPRSSIREQLLRAVLKLNDQILEEPMDTKIKKLLGLGLR